MDKSMFASWRWAVWFVHFTPDRLTRTRWGHALELALETIRMSLWSPSLATGVEKLIEGRGEASSSYTPALGSTSAMVAIMVMTSMVEVVLVPMEGTCSS